jgi:phage replication initiation protein
MSNQSAYSPIWKEKAVYQHEDGTLYRCLACGPAAVVMAKITTGERSVIRRNGPHPFVSGPGAPTAKLTAAGPRAAIGLADSGGNANGEYGPAFVPPLISSFLGSGAPDLVDFADEVCAALVARRIRLMALPVSNTGVIGGQEKLAGGVGLVGEGDPNVIDYVIRAQSSPNAAFVDTFSFTFKTGFFERGFDDHHKVIEDLSPSLILILGYGVTDQRPTGRNYYKHSYTLGNGWGFVAIGGQRDTVNVHITGEGCMAARAGWEKRLYGYLKTIDDCGFRPRITRVDLARDFFNGEYTVDQIRESFLAGEFNPGAGLPLISDMAGDWDGRKRGCTYYIGSRESGKMLRGYEKGKQLGGEFSRLFPNWNRVELELRNQAREIPLDVLLAPGQYLAGSYAPLHFIAKDAKRIKTKRNIVKIIYDAGVSAMRNQAGKWINLMMAMEGSAEKVVDLLRRDGIPNRIDRAAMDYRQSLEPMMVPRVSLDEAFAVAFAGGGG